jgi:uncharacterized protein (TIGR02266 family)
MFRTFGGIVDMRRQPDIAEAEQQPKVHLRRELRQPLTVLKATNNSGPKTLFGYACNISRSGMLISTINPRKPGSRYEVEFSLPEPANVVARCECEVVWKRTWAKEDRHRPGMGLRFLDLSEEAAAAIEEWVEREARTELRLSSIRPKLAT